jgi:hypothetical protein
LIDGAEPRRQTRVGPIEPKPKPKAKPEIAKPKHKRRTARERLEIAALGPRSPRPPRTPKPVAGSDRLKPRPVAPR